MINFIVNFGSGKGAGYKCFKTASAYLDKHNIHYSVFMTKSPGDAERTAAIITKNGPCTIAAIGGDGTFHEVLNGISDLNNTSVGFIPAGRGNDYARSANLPKDTVKALKAIVSGETVLTDFLSIGGRRCLNAAGMGLDTAVLDRVKGKNGKITYLKSLIYCLRHFKPYSVKAETETEKIRFDNIIMLGLCNGTAIGGGMKVSPDSKIADGLMEAVFISVPGNGKIMGALTKFLKGRHIGLEYTRVVTCKKITITSHSSPFLQMDGELYPSDFKPLECEVVHGGLKVFKV